MDHELRTLFIKQVPGHNMNSGNCESVQAFFLSVIQRWIFAILIHFAWRIHSAGNIHICIVYTVHAVADYEVQLPPKWFGSWISAPASTSDLMISIWLKYIYLNFKLYKFCDSYQKFVRMHTGAEFSEFKMKDLSGKLGEKEFVYMCDAIRWKQFENWHLSRGYNF